MSLRLLCLGEVFKTYALDIVLLHSLVKLAVLMLKLDEPYNDKKPLLKSWVTILLLLTATWSCFYFVYQGRLLVVAFLFVLQFGVIENDYFWLELLRVLD